MSSYIRLTKTCEFCSIEFTAKTLKTRYCSHSCNSKAYKALKRDEKLKDMINPPNPTFPIDPLRLKTAAPDYQTISKKEFLTIAEACVLLNITSVTLRRWIKDQVIKTARIRKKHIVNRADINLMLS